VSSQVLFISARVTFQLFKVIQGQWIWHQSNARISDFLLVRNSNLGPTLHRFGDFAAFMCSWPHPYSTLIFGVFSLHQITHIGASERVNLKAIRPWNYFRKIPTYVITVPKRYGRTDGRTDGRVIAYSALCIYDVARSPLHIYSMINSPNVLLRRDFRLYAEKIIKVNLHLRACASFVGR